MITTPEAPPPARLALHRKFVCPRCRALQHAPDLREGECWYRCERRRCAQHYLVIALPAGSTGHALADRVGAPLARDVILRAWPELLDLPLPAFWLTVLVTGRRPAYLMLTVRPDEREALRFATLPQILRTLTPEGR